MKMLENRWVEFCLGCGIILIAYTGSPRTMTEVFIAIGGTALGGLLLIVSWMQDCQHSNSNRRRTRS
jgi:hypothetical protein